MKISFSSTIPRSKDVAIVGWKKQEQSEVLRLPSGERTILLDH